MRLSGMNEWTVFDDCVNTIHGWYSSYYKKHQCKSFFIQTYTKIKICVFIVVKYIWTKTSMQSVNVYRRRFSMILSTWNFEYVLQLQLTCMNTVSIHLYETSNDFIYDFRFFRIHFHQSGPLKVIKTMLKSVRVLLGLSPVLNRYPKSSHSTGTITV